MMKLFRLITAATFFISHLASAGICSGSAGCWSLSCNNSIECTSAGCGACENGDSQMRREFLRLPEDQSTPIEKARPVHFEGGDDARSETNRTF